MCVCAGARVQDLFEFFHAFGMSSSKYVVRFEAWVNFSEPSLCHLYHYRAITMVFVVGGGGRVGMGVIGWLIDSFHGKVARIEPKFN